MLVAFRILFLGLFEGMPGVNLLGFSLPWYGFMCLCASLSMAACFYLSQRGKKENAPNRWDVIFDGIYSFLAAFYVFVWLLSWVRQPWSAFSLCVQGIALFAIAVLTNLRRFRVYCYCLLGMASMWFLWEPIGSVSGILKWFIVAFNVLSVFGVYHAIKYLKQTNPEESLFEYEERFTFILGLLLLVFCVHLYVYAQWISLTLGILSAVMILLGFAFGHKTERMGGMGLLALTLGRVVFVDLSGLDIVFKIITLIILGVLFLGVSYVYNRFSINGK